MPISRTLQNLTLGVVLLSLPLAAAFWTATPQNVPGTGFAILLYKPFNFAYLLLACILFVALNLSSSKLIGRDKWADVIGGIFFTAIWFVIAFFALGEFHRMLGGTL